MSYSKNQAPVGLNKEFYSGSQASIFIGDLWVDDICDWQYQVNYSATPIYGYGAALYSHVAEGRVLVQGSFSINFREPNYLWAILKRYDFKNASDIKPNPLDVKSTMGNINYSQNDISYINDKRANLDLFFNTSKPDELTAALQKERSFTKEKANTEEIDFTAKTFDITIGYGTDLNEDSPGQKLVGVKLVGKSKLITIDGSPIREQYNFFARNII
ncbi:MAG: hypothetical protein PHY47_00375 [Lachnospiraceae bacterium]|nr:hypothetical protein [Lachnospiraceae bacterium]